MGSEASEILLRFKALAGDGVEAIVGRCLTALMRMNPGESLEFVARFLDSAGLGLAQEAALVLAESRHDKTFDLLRQAWAGHMDSEYRTMLLVPMAVTRREEACAFLCEVIANGPEKLATAAIRGAKPGGSVACARGGGGGGEERMRG